MAILVTGAAGFIGRHFCELLLRTTTETVVGLDNFNDFYDPAIKRAGAAALAKLPRFTMVEGDFCDAATIERILAKHAIDRVMHLGAYAGVRPSVERPFIYQQVNVGGTLNLLEAARKHPVQRFVLASSSTVYGHGATSPFREDAPLGPPLSPYGASKRAAELFGLTYHQLHRVPVVAARPFSVYGPGLRPDLAIAVFTKAIHVGEALPLYGDGSIRRDFTHVSDLCAGLFGCLFAPNVEGEAINLGHDRPVAMSRVIELIGQNLGREPVIDRRPQRTEDLLVTCASLKKARRLLGYEPKVAFEDGIRDYVQWFLRSLEFKL